METLISSINHHRAVSTVSPDLLCMVTVFFTDLTNLLHREQYCPIAAVAMVIEWLRAEW